jgi:hypothetical protein
MDELDDPLSALDDYEFRNLVFHLRQAGQHAALDGLLRLELNDRNAWYEAHLRRGDIGGFASDIQLVVESARRDRTEPPGCATRRGIRRPAVVLPGVQALRSRPTARS